MPPLLEDRLKKQLKLIRGKVEEMGIRAEEAVESSLKALIEENRRLAYSIILRDQVIDNLEKEYGRLDGLVNNAGILGERSPIEHYDQVLWQRVLHINLTGSFLMTQACMPLIRRSEDASVIFTSSGVGRRGKAYWGAYSVSKFGVEGLAQVLADELGKNEANINDELLAAQGQPADLGGYYKPDDEKAALVMRPSAVFNKIIESL